MIQTPQTPTLVPSHEILFQPGFDKSSEPGGFGVHGMHLVFKALWRKPTSLSSLLASPLLAVVFEINTGWYPTTVRAKNENFRTIGWSSSVLMGNAHAWSLCYHSSVQLSSEDEKPRPNCSLLGGAPCYSDQKSHALSDALFESFINSGPDPVWTALDAWGAELLVRIAQVEQDRARYS